MTTYILHGGRATRPNPQNDAFFEQFTQLVHKDTVTILLCYLAREKEKWDSLIEKDTQSIKKNTEKEVRILVAEDPNDMLHKMDIADVLYVSGGEAEQIEPLYTDLTAIAQKIQGKVYAGSSMGVFFAVENYVLSFDTQDSNTVHQGIGMLPIQALCHWDLEQRKDTKLKLLSDTSDKPILVLNESTFVVLYK